MTKFRWVMRPAPDVDIVEHLVSSGKDFPVTLARVLALRGIKSRDSARLYFRPDLSHVHDPFLMKDMEAAADRVIRAIDQRERVLVYGDYDVDGTTATALMVSFLQDNGIDAVYFIPHRVRDGYGLRRIGIDFAVDSGVSLIIALDCGITAHAEAAYAKDLGLDLVICDHHMAEETIPDAVAVLDPKRPDCSYPFDGLSGCGVGFKLIQAVLQKRGIPADQALPYLDLVALSIASDIVPIVGENRVLMRAGLQQIRANPRLGLKKLAQATGQDLSVCDTGKIVFGIGPRINAAGRLADARLAVDLMLTGDELNAERLANELESINKDRRELDGVILKEALEDAREWASSNALVLHRPHWHVGVIGIVASRLVERYYRPVVMLTTVEGNAKGSARSIKGFNIYEALLECAPLLSRFGGHAYAAGMTLSEENVPLLRSTLNEVAGRQLSGTIPRPDIEIDTSLHLEDLNDRFWNVLKQFAPFGPENKQPVFVSTGLSVVGHPSIVGSGHLKFKVRQSDGRNAEPFDVIGFNMHEHLPMIRSHRNDNEDLQMVFSIDQNTWNGRSSLQLRLKDVRSGADGGVE
ncbi:MAG: single-stranded-DNA-specific exonuclease RecJ [Rhodothermia bacterium]